MQQLQLRRCSTLRVALAVCTAMLCASQAAAAVAPSDTLVLPGEIKLICPTDPRQGNPVSRSEETLRSMVGLLDITEVNNYTYNIITAFDRNAQHDPNDPGLPRFAIVGKEDKFYLGIGGYVKATASYDFGNPIDNPSYFATSYIPTGLAKGNGGLWQMGAGTSCLYFNFVGLPQTKNRFGAYLGFNFTGNNYTPKLQAAYISFRNVVMGYKYTLFFDGAACPATVDQEGPNSIPAINTLGIHYVWQRGRMSYGVGIENTEVCLTTDDATAEVYQRVPTVPAYAQLSFADGDGSVRLSGLVRPMQYRDVAADRNRSLVGWGVQLTGTAPVASLVNLYWQGLYGRGVADFVQDMSGLGLDLVPSLGREGRMQAVPFWAGLLGFSLNLSDRVTTNHGYSQTRTYARRELLAADGPEYRYAQYAVNNVFVSITDNVRFGFEYLYGRLATNDALRRSDHRVQAMMQVYF